MTNLITIKNRHVDPAPELQTEGKYVGYFEGMFGDQWVFIGDRSAKTAIITGGDIGWEQLTMSEGDLLPQVILSPDEYRWLEGCQRAFFGKSWKKTKAGKEVDS